VYNVAANLQTVIRAVNDDAFSACGLLHLCQFCLIILKKVLATASF
jgi:hypothetical protein